MAGDPAVVDASALAALLFGEPGGADIAHRLDGRALFAPTLLRYELARVCREKQTREPEKERELLAALGLFPRLEVREVEVSPDVLVETAKDTDLTVYDAAYLWLSRELGTDLVTLDARLKAATQGPSAS